jgi:hypothetical protein
VADALLCSRIEGTANINADNEGLRRGETATAVKKLTKGSTGKTLADYKDVPLALEGYFAMVKYRLDAGVAKTGSDIELLLKGCKGVIRGS